MKASDRRNTTAHSVATDESQPSLDRAGRAQGRPPLPPDLERLEPQQRVAELRIRARRLLRQLRSADPSENRQAALRFRHLRGLGKPESVLSRRGSLQLKHALTVVALETGYSSWTAVKRSLEGQAVAPQPSSRLRPWSRTGSDLMYSRGMDVLLNRWFAHYAEARESLEEQGGFLLPFRSQFFICEAEGIRLLGLDPEDPDWSRIGHDWVEPADAEAHERLREKRLLAVREAESNTPSRPALETHQESTTSP